MERPDRRAFKRRAAELLGRLRERRPLVHHITNYVVMNDTANLTLQLGASPVMAHSTEEVVEMVSLADALVLNPGTLEPSWVEAMLLAGRAARDKGIPVVLDPVGAGATRYRTRVNQELLDRVGPTVVRGNGGEIGALRGAGGAVRGVDSVGELEAPGEVAAEAARAWGATVAITGAIDRVSDGSRNAIVENGHPWMASLTGTGCMATTAVACFAAVEQDAWIATCAALASYGLAAELAAERSAGPGSFRSALLDAAFHLAPERVADGARLESCEPRG